MLSYDELLEHDIDVFIWECWVMQINVLIDTFKLYWINVLLELFEFKNLKKENHYELNFG